MNAALPQFITRLTTNDIQLTDAAHQELRNLSVQTEEPIQGVRIFVAGGGCGGMAYGMSFAEEVTAFDALLEHDGFRLVIDAVALNYLQGCTIDFTQNGSQSTFVFKNVFQAVGGSGRCGGCGGASG